LQLAALILDLAEQARVLDRQHRLGRERLQEMYGILGKVARLFAADHKRSHNFVNAEQRHSEPSTIACPHRDLSDRARWLIADIGNLLRLSRLRRLTDRIGSAEVLVLHSCNQVFAETIGRPQSK